MLQQSVGVHTFPSAVVDDNKLKACWRTRLKLPTRCNTAMGRKVLLGFDQLCYSMYNLVSFHSCIGCRITSIIELICTTDYVRFLTFYLNLYMYNSVTQPRSIYGQISIYSQPCTYTLYVVTLYVIIS